MLNHKPAFVDNSLLLNSLTKYPRLTRLLAICILVVSYGDFSIFSQTVLGQNSQEKTYREYSARASAIDPRVKAYPEIDFLLEKDGKPSDIQHACRRPDSVAQGKLVVWLMGNSPELFHFLADEGFHVIRVHYANGWFNRFGKEPPPEDRYTLGKIRLEAATGQDSSELIAIEKPDGMQHRVGMFLQWLNNQDPEGNWNAFLKSNPDGEPLVDWERVIVSGASHGATTSARFALHQKVDRVVMFCGPRDQYEIWQALESATPKERFFGFSHILDTGWSGHHYCRSWELLGLQAFGPIVNVDQVPPPYGNSRRLVTDADVGQDDKRAHSCVTPGKAAVKSPSGEYLHKNVWKYLFTHPVNSVGSPTANDPDCKRDLIPKKS